MHFITKDIKYKTDDELDIELTRLYNEDGMEPLFLIKDKFLFDSSRVTTIKFKCK